MVEIGEILDEKYRIVRLVGEGGTGAVYEAQDEELDKRVAIKIPGKALLEDAVALARFEREPRFAARLGHRNIIDIYAVGTMPDGARFMVMEYLDGESLGARLEREERLDATTALYVIAQVLSALDTAHGKKIIHRDLKPDNIFLVESGRELPDIKILDFGMSKSSEGSLAKSKLTELGVVVGTPYYMAPELFDGEGVPDNRADIYSAGVVLYEMLTGTLPFSSSNLMGLVNKVLNEEAAPLSELCADISPGIEEVVQRALARRRERRFRSAIAMLHAMLPFIDDETAEGIVLPEKLKTAKASGQGFEARPIDEFTSSKIDAEFEQEVSPDTDNEDEEATDSFATPVGSRDSGEADRRDGYDTDPGEDKMLGRTVAGRFTIVRRIRSGGMGTVYEAVQEPVGRTVALKILREDLAQNPVVVERFKREAQAVSLLESNHSITLYDFGQDESETLYLAMEFVQGTTLKDNIREEGPLAWRVSLGLAGQIGEALLEAHDKGIVHRDLKSDNVLLSADLKGERFAKVVDFGIARLSHTDQGEGNDITHTGTIFGTPGYMSPEQAQGSRVDHRSDIYSLGVVMFEMLAGKPPFEADAAVLLMGKHIISKIPSVASRSPEVVVPVDVERLVRWMMSKDPEQRPESLAKVIEVIERLLAEKSVDIPDNIVGPTPRDEPSKVPEEVIESSTEEATHPEARQAWGSGLKVLAPLIVVVVLGVLGFVAITQNGSDERSEESSMTGRYDGEETLSPISKSTSPDAGQTSASSLNDSSRAGDSGHDEVTSNETVESRARVTVNVVPATSKILIEGHEVEGNPYEGVFNRDGSILRIEAISRGYSSQTKLVTLDGDKIVDFELSRARVGKNTSSDPPSKSKSKMLIEVNPY